MYNHEGGDLFEEDVETYGCTAGGDDIFGGNMSDDFQVGYPGIKLAEDQEKLRQ